MPTNYTINKPSEGSDSALKAAYVIMANYIIAKLAIKLKKYFHISKIAEIFEMNPVRLYQLIDKYEKRGDKHD